MKGRYVMYNYKNKIKNIKTKTQYMLARSLSMFEYSNLPTTLPRVEIEKQLQQNGFTFITEIEGELYALYGSLGGETDVYGNPTKIAISNPTLNFNKTLSIDDDGVLIKNDDMQLGLLPLYERYNTMLTENEITMFINLYNTRIQQLISAGDDATRESAEKYISKIIKGELGIIGENRLFDGISVQNTNTNQNITNQLIEFNQYIKASLFNEIGLNMNFNMKRERLNQMEVNMNSDGLHPLVDNMLYNRQQGVEKLNEKYGLSASVEFGSIWKVRNKQDIEEHEETQEETIVIDGDDDESILETDGDDDEPILETDDEPILETGDEDDELKETG
mgnify:FL=1